MRTSLKVLFIGSILAAALIMLVPSLCDDDSSALSDIRANWGYSDGTLRYFGPEKIPDYTKDYNPVSELGAQNATEIDFHGESITYIGDYTFYNCKITAISLPKSVEHIGDYAFAQEEATETAAATFDFHSGIKYIGKNAFLNQSLVSVHIPNSVTTLGESAFYGCTCLKTLVFDDSASLSTGYLAISRYAFQGCKSLERVEIGNTVWEIDDYAFNSDTSLSEVVIGISGSALTSINQFAFEGTALTAFTIPDSVQSLGDSAFKACNKLKTVSIGKSMTKIPGYCFEACISLATLTVPDWITEIGEMAFYRCSALESVLIGNSASIGYKAFSECTSIKSINLSEGITIIADAAFSGCTSLETVTVPGTLTSAGGEIFSGCKSMTSIKFSTGLKTVPESMCADCSKLKNIEFADSVTKIGNSAFLRCTALKELVLSDWITSLGESAFQKCTSLNKLQLPISVNSVVSNLSPAFDGCLSISSFSFTSGSGKGYDYGATSNDPNFYGYTPWHLSLDMVNEMIFDKNIISIGKNTFNNYSFYDKNGNQMSTSSLPGNKMTGSYASMTPYVEQQTESKELLTDEIVNMILIGIIIVCILSAFLMFRKVLKVIRLD